MPARYRCRLICARNVKNSTTPTLFTILAAGRYRNWPKISNQSCIWREIKIADSMRHSNTSICWCRASFYSARLNLRRAGFKNNYFTPPHSPYSLSYMYARRFASILCNWLSSLSRTHGKYCWSSASMDPNSHLNPPRLKPAKTQLNSDADSDLIIAFNARRNVRNFVGIEYELKWVTMGKAAITAADAASGRVQVSLVVFGSTYACDFGLEKNTRNATKRTEKHLE